MPSGGVTLESFPVEMERIKVKGGTRYEEIKENRKRVDEMLCCTDSYFNHNPLS